MRNGNREIEGKRTKKKRRDSSGREDKTETDKDKIEDGKQGRRLRKNGKYYCLSNTSPTVPREIQIEKV